MRPRHLIFDLDNTLYPSSAEMDRGITRRMILCVAEFLGVSYGEALKARDREAWRFSTTLEWLRAKGLVNTENYFARVHPENEADELPADENLRPLLKSIDIPKIILTNAPSEHAERVLSKLGVPDLFDGIVDIRRCGLRGKPYSAAYEIALAVCEGTAEDTIFIDDMLKYTDGWTALGGTAALVGSENGSHLSEELIARKYAIGSSLPPGSRGKTFRIDSIYGLPALLDELAEV